MYLDVGHALLLPAGHPCHLMLFSQPVEAPCSLLPLEVWFLRGNSQELREVPFLTLSLCPTHLGREAPEGDSGPQKALLMITHLPLSH